MVTSLLSLARGVPVRSDVAMTGEVSLTGKVRVRAPNGSHHIGYHMYNHVYVVSWYLPCQQMVLPSWWDCRMSELSSWLGG